MATFSFWLSLAVFVLTAGFLLQMVLGLKRVGFLADLPDDLPALPPAVSIVVSALNEADTLEPALRSLLAQDYPRLEIVALNDRSTDGTGALLDRLAREHPQLRVIHITELPAGWLGKNHALHVGAQAATGDYLLFTDADVVFAPGALRRAVGRCERERIDHLVVMAEFVVHDHLLAALLLNFYSGAFAMHPPWRVRTSPGVYIGMGAFNMVRAVAYRQAGGHASLRMEVIDDLMLGQRMKAAGFEQDVLLGRGSVMVAWYRDTGGLMRGLEKNAFATVDYSVAALAGYSVVFLVLRYWPLAGLLVTGGVTWWLNLGAIAAVLLLYLRLLPITRWSRHCLWWWPVSAALILFILWRGVLRTLRRGGIDWRGTFYPLAALRRARPR